MPGGPLAGGAGAARDAGIAGRIDVAVVDDHPIIRDGITGWVAVPDSGIRVVATATTVDAVLAGPGAGRACGPARSGSRRRDHRRAERGRDPAPRARRSWCCPPRTGRPRSGTRCARERAATSLKHEEAAELRAAIRAVAAGEDWVSPRLAYIFATDDAPDRPALSAQETRTLRLYATGLPIKSVARRLGIGEETAKQYVRRVREKYAQANRAAPTKVDLYHRAVEDGHLPSPP